MVNNIDPNAYYSPRKLVVMKILPWTSTKVLSKKITEPRWNAIFKPIYDKTEKSTLTYIKGENIIKFLELQNSNKLNQSYEQESIKESGTKGDI